MQYKIASQFNVPNSIKLSVNRCPVIPDEMDLLFMNTIFRLGMLTPFTANDCSGPHFTLDDKINILIEDEQKQISGKPFNIQKFCSESTNNHKSLPLVSEQQVIDQRNCLIEESKSSSNPVNDIYCPCSNPSDTTKKVNNDIHDLESDL